MNDRHVANALYILLLIVLGMSPAVSAAAGGENYQVVGGVAIYLGVIPSEMILGHPGEHPERAMHGGVPSGKHRDHVVVALFDNASGKRITDAQVTATVREIGLAGETKKLQSMQIAGTITYGNYFDLPSSDIYRVLLEIRRPGRAGVIKAEFTHRHSAETE